MVNDYQVGGSLPMDAVSYVVRAASPTLRSIKTGRIFYVLNAHQMGKSSLMVRMMNRLRQDGYCCRAIDLTRISGKKVTIEQLFVTS